MANNGAWRWIYLWAELILGIFFYCSFVLFLVAINVAGCTKEQRSAQTPSTPFASSAALGHARQVEQQRKQNLNNSGHCEWVYFDIDIEFLWIVCEWYKPAMTSTSTMTSTAELIYAFDCCSESRCIWLLAFERQSESRNSFHTSAILPSLISSCPVFSYGALTGVRSKMYALCCSLIQ